MNHEQLYRDVERIVFTYRTELENVWPTPPTGDCLKFAVTEAAEVIDAELRNNAAYARNNEKMLDPLDEVADCLMMLTTFIIVAGLDIQPESFEYETPTLTLCSLTADAARFYHSPMEGEIKRLNGKTKRQYLLLHSVICAVTICIDLLGEDAPNRVEQRLERIKEKVSERYG